MRFLVVSILVSLVALPVAARNKEAEKKEAEDWAQSLDKESTHNAVLLHEQDPLGKDAKKVRPVLAVHFKPLDYVVCLDQIGPLLDKKTDISEAVFWQVVFGSGDFVEQNPAEAGDKLAYMQAGLESGLRAYENALRTKPKGRIELLDRLIGLRDKGQLQVFVKEHPCDGK